MGSNENNTKKTFKLNKNPEMDALLTSFFIENHLDYYTYPDHVATPEQVKFMVYLEDNERYYPCSDSMFEAIMSRKRFDFLQEKYNEILQKVLKLIERQIGVNKERKYLTSLIKIKHRHETKDEMMIPARLEKRLFRIFQNHSQIEDPCIFEKALRNRRASMALHSEAFTEAINHVAGSAIASLPETLTEIRELVEQLELKRLLALSVESSLWKSDKAETYTKDDYLNKLFNRKITGNGVEPLFRFLGILGKDKPLETAPRKKLLWLPDEAGEVMVDLAIIQFLAKLGHKIIIALKEGSLYTKIDFNDTQEDEILSRGLEGAFTITEKSLSKKGLINILRSDNHIIIISDGTRETLNLLLASTTFARVFKEVDGVISRGSDQRQVFFDTHFQFTQDIFNISPDAQDSVLISYRPRHPAIIKFSHENLERKARTIIDQMEKAKKKGMPVIFYSGIIGSIPGKIKMAKKLMSVFIQLLKKRLAGIFIINPSKYYEPGMDADDLMYMWEIVQRSGFIDIWRFQTYSDIVQTFQFMKKKVPPEWVGKDATFSTGCTKEMNIALEVQQKYPEMQIIGPSKEKFMRRHEYGIGKMYDQRLSHLCRLPQ